MYYSTGHVGINFYWCPTPVSKVLFGASCLCQVMGAASSGTVLATSFAGITITGWLGALDAQGFNRLGKYTFQMGNVTSGNITDNTELVS